MPRKKKSEPPVDNIPQVDATNHEEVKERMRNHISDKNSRISEEDILNVKVDSLPPTDIREETGTIIPHPEKEKEDDDKLPGKTTDGHNKHVTPWDVVGE